MSQRSVELTWPMGSHMVAAPIGVIRAIQFETGFGLERLAELVAAGDGKDDQLMSCIINGLVAHGDHDAPAARRLCLTCIEENGLLSLKAPALEVLALALVGFPEEAPDDHEDDDDAGKR